MIRRASIDDVPALTELRAAMWSEMHPEAPTDDALRAATSRWLEETLPVERAHAWLAFEDERVVGMAILLVHDHPPRIHGPEVRGYVTAVFVEPDARRRGHARAMLEAIVAFARTAGMKRVMLRTSDDGRRVYESVGLRSMEVLAIDL